MTVAVGVVLGAIGAVFAWPLARDVFSGAVFQATNHRGRMVPVGVGVLLALVAVAAEALFTVADASGHGPGAPGERLLVLLVAVGFALVGLLDDLAASGDDHGFGGHLRAAAQGRLTTGGMKVLGGGLMAIVVAGAVDGGDGWRLLADAALIALSANAGNLFDRAPGRATKVGLIGFLVLVSATGASRPLTGVAVVVGATLGLLAFELREELMLGDAGANALGAVLGLGVVLTTSFGVRLIVLAGVIVLNALGERVSFSSVIDRVRPLRFLDRLGRRR